MDWGLHLRARLAGNGTVRCGFVLFEGEFWGRDCAPVIEVRTFLGEWHCVPRVWRDQEKWRFEVVLNGFLLPNGKHVLVFRAWVDERKTSDHRVKFLLVNREELASGVTSAFRESALPLILPYPINYDIFPPSPEEMLPWFDRPDRQSHLRAIREEYALSLEQAQACEHFVRDGYCILQNAVPERLLYKVNKDLDQEWRFGYSSLSAYSGEWVEHLFMKLSSVRELWNYPPLRKLLSALFDDDPLPCQTLNFFYGSEQAEHQDALFLTSYPPSYMIGLWIALEDIHADAGPLKLYPGSHRLGPIYRSSLGFSEIVDERTLHLRYQRRVQEALDRQPFPSTLATVSAGSVILWHSGLVHAGAKRNNLTLSRRSLVVHYYARGCAAYYDASGLCAHTYHELKA